MDLKPGFRILKIDFMYIITIKNNNNLQENNKLIKKNNKNAKEKRIKKGFQQEEL